MCIKWFKSAKKRYEKCEVEIIEKRRYFWLIRKDLEIESGVDNWDPKKQKYRHELMPNTAFQCCRMFVRNDLVGKKIKS